MKGEYCMVFNPTVNEANFVLLYWETASSWSIRDFSGPGSARPAYASAYSGQSLQKCYRPLTTCEIPKYLDREDIRKVADVDHWRRLPKRLNSRYLGHP